MKILVLVHQVGKDAPGILFERLLRSLGERATLDIACAAYTPSKGLPIRSLQTFRYPVMKYRTRRLLTLLFRGDCLARRFAEKIRIPEDSDLILSLFSNERFFALESGAILQRESGKPWAAYCVDAVPSPPAWAGNGPYRKCVAALIRRCCEGLSFFASLTAEMLQYQKQFLPEWIRTDCLLPPVESPRMRQMPPPGSRPRFLYAGRIYGQRSARVLLEAFARLSGSPELVFIGPDGERIRKEIARYAPACRERIELLPWTPDLDSELERATALMDIDAPGPDDVYLSSKLFTYLRCPRPIVSITGPGSPARRLLSGMDSVLVCPHEPEAVQKALERCSEAFDYTDRAVILSAADADALARRLLKDLAL